MDILNYQFNDTWHAGSGALSVFEKKILEVQHSALHAQQEYGRIDRAYAEFFIKNMVTFFLGKEVKVNVNDNGTTNFDFSYPRIDECASYLSGLQQLGLYGYEYDHDVADDFQNKIEKIVKRMVSHFSGNAFTLSE